jgi:hypothetical protein
MTSNHKHCPHLLLYIPCAVITLVSSRAADSLIGVNFTGGNAAGAPTLLAPAEEAGVVPQKQWNNFSDYSVMNYPLRDSAGNLTAISISYTTGEMWGSGAFSETAGTTNSNARLF